MMCLLEHLDAFHVAHLFEHLRPYRNADLAKVRFLEQKHIRSRLSDPATDAERELVADDPLVIRQLEKIELAGDFQLSPQRFSINSNTHRRQLVPTFGNWIPNEYVAVQAVHRAAVF